VVAHNVSTTTKRFRIADLENPADRDSGRSRHRGVAGALTLSATPASASTLYYEWESEKSQFN
jgi:hypothetical protein